MVITIIMAVVVGVVCGIVHERNRWVKSSEKNKVISVEGNLYKVTKTGDNAG